MFGLRLASCIGAVIMLGACQSAGDRRGVETPEDTALRQTVGKALNEAAEKANKDEEYQPTGIFDDRMDEVVVRLTQVLLTKCLDASGAQGTKVCFRERMLAGFDVAQMAERKCPPSDDVETDVKCIVLGNLTYHFVQSLSSSKSPSIDWSDPERSANAATIDYIVKQLRVCLGGSSASDPSDCLVEDMAMKLGLTSDDLAPCKVISDDFRFGQCVGEGYALKFFEEGIARM